MILSLKNFESLDSTDEVERRGRTWISRLCTCRYLTTRGPLMKGQAKGSCTFFINLSYLQHIHIQDQKLVIAATNHQGAKIEMIRLHQVSSQPFCTRLNTWSTFCRWYSFLLALSRQPPSSVYKWVACVSIWMTSAGSSPQGHTIRRHELALVFHPLEVKLDQ